MIKAPVLAYDAIIKALDAGDYYCSTGPEIHDLYLEDGRLCLDCSPVRRIALQCKLHRLRPPAAAPRKTA